MKAIIAALAVGALTLGASVAVSAHPGHAPAPPAPTAPDAGSEPARIVDAFHAALAKGDQQAVVALMADEATIFEEGHVERSKAEYVAGHLPGDMGYAKATTSERINRKAVMSGDLAYVTTEGRTRGTFRDKPVDRFVIETMVLRRQPGGWRIVHVHWSSRAAAN